MNKGELTSWNADKGYGFIRCDSTLKDVFIHISTLKHMSRQPKVGDFIYFDIEKKSNGKLAASNCRVEGVLAQKPPRSIVRQTPRVYPRSSNRKYKTKALQFLVALSMIFIVFSYINKHTNVNHDLKKVATSKSTITHNSTINKGVNSATNPSVGSKINRFSCDGRQHCSQMKSRAEAEFFIQNCPNTKMDGDRDGIPCENDSRF